MEMVGRISPQMTLPMPHLRDTDSTSEVLYPALGLAAISWDDTRRVQTVDTAQAPSACLIELRQR